MNKKYFFYAMMSAIALTGAMGFSSCSSSDEVTADVNPTYDPVAQTVNTQFVLNVAGGAMPSTRMSDVTVQKNNNFRGMQNARIFAMKTDHPTWLAPYTGTETLKQSYDLGTLYTPTAVDNSGDKNKEESSRRVLELSLPLTTDAMLVYARAIPSGTDAANGKTTTNLATVTDPKDITFNLAARIGDNATTYEHTKALAALILNRIISSNVSAQATAYVHNTISYTDLDALTWKGVAADPNAAGLAEILKNAYNSFTNIEATDMRAGSAAALKSQIYFLNKSITSVLSATATSKDELNAQRLAENINTKITRYFEGLDGEGTTDFRTLGAWDATQNKFTDGSILDNLLVNNAMTADDYNSTTGKYYGVTGETLKEFPVCFSLPDGSAQLSYNATDGFLYKSPSTSLLNKSTTDNPAKYMYPAELWYFDNSALRVNTAEKGLTDYPNGYNNWDTDSWTGWTDGANGIVSSTTRSVAVKNNINYGVSMLQTTISLASGDAFNDNRHALVATEANQVLTEAQVKQIQLTGILIGGQNNQMGWNYLAKANNNDDWNYMIYDTDIPNSGKIPTESGKEIYTLVFDNYYLGDQNDVLVALEFKNGPTDFYGVDNLIHAGGTFYLVGKLPIKKNTTEYNTISTWDSYYPIPPYTAAGASQQITRIFVQDYMTTATFKIGTNSLQSAFITVPDLRSSQTSLGLSVDLKWQPGLTFTDVELGGN